MGTRIRALCYDKLGWDFGHPGRGFHSAVRSLLQVLLGNRALGGWVWAFGFGVG